MAKSEQQLILSRAAFIERVAKLRALHDAIREQKGSQAKRLADATTIALGVTVKAGTKDIPVQDFITTNKGVSSFVLGDLANYVQAMIEWADNVAREQRDLVLKEQATGDTYEALKAQYIEAHVAVTALATILNQSDKDRTLGLNVTDIELPTAKVGTRSPRMSAGVKNVTFYRIVDSVRKPQGDAQDNFSSFAYWHGAKMVGNPAKGSTNQGKGVPVDELESFVRSKGCDSPRGKAWSFEQNGVTYGMDLLSSEEE